jgi:hypothetical protein
VSKLIVYGGRRRVSGGRLVTSAGGAPCCCGPGECLPKYTIEIPPSYIAAEFEESFNGTLREAGSGHIAMPGMVLPAIPFFGIVPDPESFTLDICGTEIPVQGSSEQTSVAIGRVTRYEFLSVYAAAVQCAIGDLDGVTSVALYMRATESRSNNGGPFSAPALLNVVVLFSYDTGGNPLGTYARTTTLEPDPMFTGYRRVQIPGAVWRSPASRSLPSGLSYVSNGTDTGMTIRAYQPGDVCTETGYFVQARPCDDGTAAPIVVDVRDARMDGLSSPWLDTSGNGQGDVKYRVTGVPALPPATTDIWLQGLCSELGDEEAATYPILSQCLDPSTTILADDANRAGEPNAVYAGEVWRDTGDRATGDPVAVTWTTDACPVPPMYRLCGTASTAEGVPAVLRSRFESDTSPAYFYTATFPSTDAGCQERWVLTYELVPDDGGSYPLLPDGAVPSAACSPPNRLSKACGGGEIQPPDFGPPIGSPVALASLTPDEEAGLGSMLAEAIKLVSAGTVQPCAACEKRRRVLNRFGNRVGRVILRRLGL